MKQYFIATRIFDTERFTSEDMAAEFSDEVSAYLQKGWRLAGNLVVTKDFENGIVVFYQPLAHQKTWAEQDESKI